MKLFLRTLVVSLILIQFSGCSKSSPTSNEDTTDTSTVIDETFDSGGGTNEFRAIAGTDLAVPVSSQITLDASNSINLNELEVSYLWAIISSPSGSDATIDDPTNITTSLTVDIEGEYIIELIMSAVEQDMESNHRIKIEAQAEFTGVQNLRLTEIMYDFPVITEIPDADRLEFLEFKNVGPTEIDLSGVIIDEGVEYIFPEGFTLGAGEFAVLINDTSERFPEIYPGVETDGMFSGRLNNSGELLRVRDAQGNILIEVEYSDEAPWPTSPRGHGFSLVPVSVNPSPNQNDPAQWKASSNIYGNPGRDDESSTTIPEVFVNEILAHTDYPEVDFVEIYNPTSNDADISGWYLTDDFSEPKMFRIPEGTIVPAGGYYVFYEEPYPTVDPIPETYFGSQFGLSQYGEDIFIFSADDQGELTGYSHGFSFNETKNGMTLGRIVTSDALEHFALMAENTEGELNTGHFVSPIVITEIFYRPLDGYHQFLELKNISDETINLYYENNPDNTWRVSGISFWFPSGVSVEPGERVVLVQNTIGTDAFREMYSLPSEMQIFNFEGNLSNSGERIAVRETDEATTIDFTIDIPDFILDYVTYSTEAPWPLEAYFSGHSIVRINLEGFGSEPENWRAGSIGGSPGSDDK